MLRLFYNARVRAYVYQCLIVLVLLGGGYALVSNAIENLRLMGLPFGFSFLSTTAGFDIGWHIIAYSPEQSYAQVYAVGIANTLVLSLLVILFSTVVGFFVGILRLSSHPLLALIARSYVEVFRNIPLLIQVIFWYLVVFLSLPSPRESLSLGEAYLNNRGLHFPSLISAWPVIVIAALTLLGWVASRYLPRQYQQTRWLSRLGKRGFRAVCYAPAVLALVLVWWWPALWETPVLGRFNLSGGAFMPSAFLAALVAMSVYRSVTIAETVRAGIVSVEQGQSDAAQVIGFSRWQTLKWIVVPQSARRIIPPMINLWLTTIKESSIAVAIGYPELVSVFMQTSLNQTGRAIEVVIMVMGFYVFTSLLISAVLNRVNSALAIVER